MIVPGAIERQSLGVRAAIVTDMDNEHIRSRLHDALHRGGSKVSEEELAEVAAVVLAVVGELAAEIALVVAELAARVEALEPAK